MLCVLRFCGMFVRERNLISVIRQILPRFLLTYRSNMMYTNNIILFVQYNETIAHLDIIFKFSLNIFPFRDYFKNRIIKTIINDFKQNILQIGSLYAPAERTFTCRLTILPGTHRASPPAELRAESREKEGE